MIFITLGSQKFQFNRLLIEVDILVEQGDITEEVFAQIGYSDYKPKNYKFKEFLDRDEFPDYMEKSDIVITHGGTGAIIGAVKKNKKVIAVPRLKEYDEHVDNHQEEIISEFVEMNYIIGISDIKELECTLNKINKCKFNSYKSNTKNILESIEGFIKSEC
ncbi:beta(1,3)galactosyltransferase EpsH [Clostridium estertheticum]|uniref:PssE/Cps14G family polysaccharide biosynthesis glycosyltransferase n=1 Tax=Clostridium estertheticum TaxID=238834 RepID=UPI0013EECFA6|nr:PssE/Cps14G family polysaccharide biosynthesis glycosyltransferase [Clostridium estertheticum]MBZ9609343.1 beta(1,3)galactosyltransferase EpsH [Clostridium estertheticum]